MNSCESKTVSSFVGPIAVESGAGSGFGQGPGCLVAWHHLRVPAMLRTEEIQDNSGQLGDVDLHPGEAIQCYSMLFRLFP